MSAIKQEKSFINATPAAIIPANWQLDEKRGLARHVSGLTVQWQASRSGQPSLDIGGLGKIKGTAWAAQIERLVQEAIDLLEG